MHRGTLLYSLLAMLLSYVHLSTAQNDASISTLGQSESTTTISVPEDPSSALSSFTESLPTETTETSTITLPPQFVPTYLPTLTIDEHDLLWSTDGDLPLTVLDEGTGNESTTDPTPMPLDEWSSWVPDNNTWSTPPPPSANLPTPPSSASTLSIYADGPVTYCKTINVWWAGGVSPFSLYYMLLEPNQTVNDYTVEYTVTTKASYGPIYIVQLGDSDMQMGQKRRGLTRIRIEDATGTSKMTWVQNLEPELHLPCGAVFGAITPKPPQSTASTVKFDDYTTVGGGTHLTTVMIATIDGQPTTIFPNVIQGTKPSDVAQPGPNVSTGSGAPPRQTGGMQSGPVVHGAGSDVNVNSEGGGTPGGNTPGGSNSFNGNTPVSSNATSNPQPGGADAPETDVQGPVHSIATGGSGSTSTGSIHGQAPNSALHSSSHRSLSVASNSLTRNNSNVSGTSHSRSLRNTSQSSTTDDQASSIIRSDEPASSSASSSSSTIVAGVANVTEQNGSGNENYIVVKVSKRVFALTVALLASAVLACAGFAFFLHRKKRFRRSESHDHLF